MLPVSKFNDNITQGPKNSKEFNKLCNDIKYDLSTLFKETNLLAEDIIHNADTLALENFFLQKRIDELESKIESIKGSDSVVKKKVISFKSKASLVSHPINDAYTDIINGVVSLPYDRISKALILSHDNIYTVAPDLAYNIFESVDGIGVMPITKDDRKMRAFNGRDEDIWWRGSEFPANSNIEKLYVVLHIKLPLQYLNNTLVNSITLRPFPEKSLKISKIQYTSPNSSLIKNLPHFPIEGISEAEETILHFPPEEIENIYILMEQPYYLIFNNSKFFYYGMRNIDIAYLDFNKDVCHLVTECDIGNEYFNIINEPEVKVAAGCPEDIHHLVSHQLYFNPSNIGSIEDSHSFNEPIGANYSKAYIVTKMKIGATYSPILEQLSFNYFLK